MKFIILFFILLLILNYLRNQFVLLFAITYPLISQYDESCNIEIINQYWFLLGILILTDYLLGFIFYFIPFFIILKFCIVYFLVYNNYQFTPFVYHYIISLIKNHIM